MRRPVSSPLLLPILKRDLPAPLVVVDVVVEVAVVVVVVVTAGVVRLVLLVLFRVKGEREDGGGGRVKSGTNGFVERMAAGLLFLG